MCLNTNPRNFMCYLKIGDQFLLCGFYIFSFYICICIFGFHVASRIYFLHLYSNSCFNFIVNLIKQNSKAFNLESIRI